MKIMRDFLYSGVFVPSVLRVLAFVVLVFLMVFSVQSAFAAIVVTATPENIAKFELGPNDPPYNVEVDVAVFLDNEANYFRYHIIYNFQGGGILTADETYPSPGDPATTNPEHTFFSADSNFYYGEPGTYEIFVWVERLENEFDTDPSPVDEFITFMIGHLEVTQFTGPNEVTVGENATLGADYFWVGADSATYRLDLYDPNGTLVQYDEGPLTTNPQNRSAEFNQFTTEGTYQLCARGTTTNPAGTASYDGECTPVEVVEDRSVALYIDGEKAKTVSTGYTGTMMWDIDTGYDTCDATEEGPASTEWPGGKFASEGTHEDAVSFATAGEYKLRIRCDAVILSTIPFINTAQADHGEAHHSEVSVNVAEGPAELLVHAESSSGEALAVGAEVHPAHGNHFYAGTTPLQVLEQETLDARVWAAEEVTEYTNEAGEVVTTWFSHWEGCDDTDFMRNCFILVPVGSSMTATAMYQDVEEDPPGPESEPPTATNLSVTQGNMCVSPLQPTFSWQFEGEEPQSAYQLQIGPVGGGYNTYGTGKINSDSDQHTIPAGYLDFNTNYQWRLKVWDVNDLESDEWIQGPNFTTPAHAGPSVDFGWSPSDPAVGETVQFTDESTSHSGSGTMTSWSWTFQDATPSSSNNENPQVSFNSTGNKAVTLQATDSSGLQCSDSKIIEILTQVPEYREVIE